MNEVDENKCPHCLNTDDTNKKFLEGTHLYNKKGENILTYYFRCNNCVNDYKVTFVHIKEQYKELTL